MPRYLDPTIDLVFKKLFGEKNHKAVTIDFLNNVLELKPGELITTITFNDPFNRKRNKQDKLSIVDVRCTDQTGKTYIVEMQVESASDFKQRCEYYVAKELASQLKAKDCYGAVTPVILVAVLGFTLFEEHKRYLTHHAVSDLYDGKVYLDSMKFHFVELAKFNKTENQLIDPIDRWIFFFKHAKEYRNNPEKIARGNKAIATAFEIVDQTNWSKKELTMYDRRVDALRLQRSRIEAAKVKEKHTIASNLLKRKMAVKDIADVTGLSVDAIKKLAPDFDRVRRSLARSLDSGLKKEK